VIIKKSSPALYFDFCAVPRDKRRISSCQPRILWTREHKRDRRVMWEPRLYRILSEGNEVYKKGT